MGLRPVADPSPTRYPRLMRLARTIFTALALAGAPLCAAHSLCVYHGQLYAETTLQEEFSDSKWVVHVKVLSADDHWSDEGDSWTIYHVEVLNSYKDGPRRRIDLFTYRNSGGFYLDKGMSNDLGGEYLLFLNPIDSEARRPPAAKGAAEVNYACGQSKLWAQVDPAELRRLKTLSQ